MWKSEVRNNLSIFMKAGLPFTLGGMIIIFSGIYLLKQFFKESEYLVVILFAWLAIFWAIYQPLFRKRIQKVKDRMNH